MQNLSNLITEQIKEPSKGDWFTKDRKWTFIFWLVMSFGSTLATSTSGINHLEELPWIIFGIIFIMLITSMLLFNKTKSIVEDRFLNSEGIEITFKQRNIEGMLLKIVSGIILAVIIFDNVLENNFLIKFMFFSLCFSNFCLYFIYKNCPISILFNFNFWKSYKVNNNLRLNNSYYVSSSSINIKKEDIITNPAYSCLLSNVYHRDRRL